LIGTIINSASIVIGSLLGAAFRGGVSPNKLDVARIGVGLVSIAIGVSMFSLDAPVLTVLLSLVIGSVLGEVIDLDARLDSLGGKLRKAIKGDSNVAESFYASTLLFVVGPMAILGPLHEAISGDLSILLSKSMLDGIASVAMSASLGFGVIFSSVSVLIYQGTFFLIGMSLGKLMPDFVIAAITSTGGVLILAIGLNLVGVTKLRVGNMLPAMIVAAAAASIGA